MEAMFRPLISTASRLLVLASALVIGLGIPLFWIWVGSKIQGGTAPTMGSLLAVLAGVLVSYSALVFSLAWLKARRGTVGVTRASWNRSMRDTPMQVQETDPAETAVVLAVIIVAVLFVVAFATGMIDPGTRG